MKTKKTRGDENCQSKDIDNKTQNEDKKNKNNTKTKMMNTTDATKKQGGPRC